MSKEPELEIMENPAELEKKEVAKLQARYPQAAKPMAGHSAFLQKRLAKGQKYFDSGDYQMAKQTGKPKPRTMPPILSVDSVRNKPTATVKDEGSSNLVEDSGSPKRAD